MSRATTARLADSAPSIRAPSDSHRHTTATRMLSPRPSVSAHEFTRSHAANSADDSADLQPAVITNAKTLKCDLNFFVVLLPGLASLPSRTRILTRMTLSQQTSTERSSLMSRCIRWPGGRHFQVSACFSPDPHFSVSSPWLLALRGLCSECHLSLTGGSEGCGVAGPQGRRTAAKAGATAGNGASSRASAGLCADAGARPDGRPGVPAAKGVPARGRHYAGDVTMDCIRVTQLFVCDAVGDSRSPEYNVVLSNATPTPPPVLHFQLRLIAEDVVVAVGERGRVERF